MAETTTVLDGLLQNATNSTGQGAESLALLFTWIDYLVFGLMLAASAGIGVYYGFFAKKTSDDTEEFLMAGKSMTTFPIAMSLIASFMSAITLLGTPSEVYQNGFVYYLIGFSYILVMPGAAYLYLPVFWDLQVTSAYEYLEIRFNPHVRRLGSAIFILQMNLYMAIVVFAPALALSQVTGINLYVSICLICFVCMFYTTLGGMKAVLWTDTLQVLVMYGTMTFIMIFGSISVGGFGYVWEKAVESGRAQLMDADPDPKTRHTVWTLIIGGYFTWVTIYGCNQAQVQRYLCVKKLYMARRALWINLIGLFSLMLICSYAGLVIYAKYWDCDPISSGIVSTGDQLFPLFVMETMGHLKGLPGLFVAGIFSGALSTVSSGMNSLAAITLEDFVKGVFWKDISERRATQLSKILSLVYGILTFALVFVAQQLGDVLSAALSIFGVVGGPLLGMFTLGMFFPWANGTGCFVGSVLSLFFMLFVGIMNQVARNFGYSTVVKMETSVDGCPDYLNVTTTATDPSELSDFLKSDLFQLSYMWYSATGCFIVIGIGLIVTAFTGWQDITELDPRTLSPGFHWVKRLIPGSDKIGINHVDKKADKDQMSMNGRSNFAFEGDQGGKSKQDFVEASRL